MILANDSRVRRRIVREKVLQALYAHEISHDPAEQVITYTVRGLEDDPHAFKFARGLVLETIKHAADIDGIIKTKVDNWDFKRIAILDRLILRMAICELTYFTDIPPKVSMNEAIELAKLFSTERSGQFVNGVLDAVLADMKNAGEIQKSGRGLYNGDGTPRAEKRHRKNKA